MWNLDKHKGSPALLDDKGDSVTYSDIAEESKAIGDKIGGRCVIFALCTNSIGSIVGYASFLENRIVPVMLSSEIDRNLLSDLDSKYRPAFYWAPSDMEFEGLEKVHEYKGYSLLRTGYERYEINPDTCVLLTTSGSTGNPKLVRQSYRNVLSNTESIIEYLKIDSSERPITILPFNYTYGISVVNTHLYAGATILVTDKSVMQKEFWAFFKEQGATSISGVPYTYEMLERLRFRNMKLDSLKTMTQAGGRLSESLQMKFGEYALSSGRRFFVMYGQCEATARMAYLPPEHVVDHCGFIGVAIPGGEFMLTDTDGKLIESPNTAGERVYKGDNVTLGYALSKDDLTKGDERNGILHTGDIAERDEQGFYRIVGRMNRFLKVYGNRVNMDDVEKMVNREFSVDCACVGRDDHVVLCVVSDDSVNPKIIDFISQKTNINRIAISVRNIPEIPRNESGKISYKTLNDEVS